jgi:hypothetical protein
MQTILKLMADRTSRSILLPEKDKYQGYGPADLDIPACMPELHVRDIRFPREMAENYLANLGLPLRVVPLQSVVFK